MWERSLTPLQSAATGNGTYRRSEPRSQTIRLVLPFVINTQLVLVSTITWETALCSALSQAQFQALRMLEVSTRHHTCRAIPRPPQQQLPRRYHLLHLWLAQPYLHVQEVPANCTPTLLVLITRSRVTRTSLEVISDRRLQKVRLPRAFHSAIKLLAVSRFSGTCLPTLAI